MKEIVMAGKSAVQDVDVDTTGVEEDVDVVAEGATAEKAPKTPKAPKRASLPEGLATPVGLAKFVSERDGIELKPQMVYSYLKNAPKDAPFPYVQENEPGEHGGRKQVFNLAAGVAWWDARASRTAEKKAAAADKKAAKEAKAAAKASETPAAAEGTAVEAE